MQDIIYFLLFVSYYCFLFILFLSESDKNAIYNDDLH